MELVSRFPSINTNDQSQLSVYARGKEIGNKIFPRVYEKKNKKINYSIEEPRPYINLKQLEALIDKNNNNKSENIDYHEYFMKNYHTIFHKDDPQDAAKAIDSKPNVPAIAYYSQKPETNKNQSKKVNTEANGSHDIKFHIEKIRRTQTTDEYDIEEKKAQLIEMLRKLLKKFPFERNEIENREIFSILYDFEEFRSLFPAGTTETIMEKFCSYAVLETVPEKGTPVFGHFAFYLILKGSVKTMSIPHINTPTTKLRSVTPEPKNPIELEVGSCFGTITELKGRDITTKMFRVMTREDHCELLKLSFESYSKITKKLILEENTEKFKAIRNCKAYSQWPKHAVEELINVFEWRSFAPNTILASEGYRSPFIGFVIKGACHVLRKVDIKVHNKKLKQDVKKMKQVVIGKMQDGDSFGEKSVAMNEQMHCTIVTESKCNVGVILYDRISELDNITVRLLLQTDNSSFSNLTQDELHKKFIDQEKKKEWKEFKNSVVNNVVNKYGIVYGQGKHSDC